MSYNGSGTFQINTSGQPVVAGTVISSTAFNALTADLATGLSTAITKDGQTTTTARIVFAQGINSSLATDTSSGATGSIFTAGGVGIAKALYVGTNANVAGTLAVTGVATFSAAPIYSSLTASSAVATDASKALVSVTNTGTGNNVLATSPTLVTPILGTPQSGTLTNATGLPLSTGVTGTLPEANGGTGTTTGYYGFKNRIINGAMAIDQRKAGASVAVSNTDSYAGIDRYSVIDYSNAATWQQLTTSPPAGFQYFGCLKRNSATSGANILAITQVVESNNCFDLQSQSVTLSFWAKAGANFSAASSNITASVQTGTGTNQSAAAFRGGTWTGQATTVTSTFAITTSWVKYTITGTVSATATQIGVQFQFTSVGTAGADDSLNVTGVQLEKGSTATSFDYRPYGTELALCQRYYRTSFPYGTAPAQNAGQQGAIAIQSVSTSANTISVSIQVSPPMRTNPTTVTYYNPSAANALWRNTSSSADGSAAGQINGASTGWTIFMNGAPSAIGNTYQIQYSADAEL
jgi:hypothetical protein